jgi:hypothetical protein
MWVNGRIQTINKTFNTREAALYHATSIGLAETVKVYENTELVFVENNRVNSETYSG